MTESATSGTESAQTGSVSAPSSTPSASTPSSTPPSAAPSESSNPNAGSPAPAFDINNHLDAPLKLKINGTDKEFTLAKLMQDAQKYEAANERFTKATELEKRVAAQEKLFKENPRKAMQELGIDPFEFSQMTLEEYLKESEKTPEQKELERLKAFEQEHMTKQQQQEQAKQQQEFQAHVAAKTQELDTVIPELIEKHGLIKDISSAQRIADVMLEAMDNGMDLTYEMAARLVKKEQEDYFKTMASRMSPEQLYKFLGDDGFKKAMDFNLSKVKQSPVPQQQQQTAPKPANGKEESLAAYNRRLRQELGL